MELFDWALRPPSSPPPPGDLAALNEPLADAVRYAASIEQITILGPWTTIADSVLAQAAEAERQARARERLEAARAGSEPANLERRLNTAGREARRAMLAKFSDEPWQADVQSVAITDAELRMLAILARLPLSAPLVLAVLLDEPLKERALRYRLSTLHQHGLVATSAITVAGRSGRRAPAYAVSARGRELLRHRWSAMRADAEPPRHLRAERKLPEPGRGSMVPHELAVQLVTGALRAYGGTTVDVQWLTPEMPGGQLSVELLHGGDDGVRLEDLTTRPGLAVIDERSDARGVVVPDISVRLDGPLAGQPRTLSLLIEVDRTARGSYNSEKFVAYDHFLAGWCLKTRRYGRELRARPVVVFVAQNPHAALRLLARADEEMTVGLGLPGHERSTYQFYGRTHTVFTCMTWLLGGHAYGLRMRAGRRPCAAATPRWRPSPWPCCPRRGGPSGRRAPRSTGAETSRAARDAASAASPRVSSAASSAPPGAFDDGDRLADRRGPRRNAARDAAIERRSPRRGGLWCRNGARQRRDCGTARPPRGTGARALLGGVTPSKDTIGTQTPRAGACGLTRPWARPTSATAPLSPPPACARCRRRAPT